VTEGVRGGFGKLLALPFAFAVAFAVAALAAGDAAVPRVLTLEVECGRLIAIAGAVVAAGTFERGDYLRRAWLLGLACFVALLLADAAALPAVAATLGDHADLYRGTVSLVANVGWIAQIWILARAWSVAGLHDDPAEAADRRAWLSAAVVVAVAIEAGPLVHDLRSVLAGRIEGLTDVSAEIGAGVGLALLVPVMRTARTMRGGLLWWPWGLLTASGVSWAALDAVTATSDAFHATGARVAIITEIPRALACGFYCAAGLAQRRAVSGPGA
jgi:hypothetical protein